MDTPKRGRTNRGKDTEVVVAEALTVLASPKPTKRGRGALKAKGKPLNMFAILFFCKKY